MKNNEKIKSLLPKKGDKIELTVSVLNEDGEGIAVHNSTQVRVKGGLPGEKILAKVTYSSQHRITADRIKIFERSPQRIPSPCGYISQCDGCPLIEMDYSSQLKWKENHVANNIHQHKSLQNVEILPVAPSPKKLQYRSSAKLVIAGKFAAPLIGLYKKESHDILDISECMLHHPLINRIVAVVKKGIIKGKVPIYHPKSCQGLLRYLIVRVAESENKAMVVLVTSKRSYNELHHLAAYISKEVPEVKVIAQNVNSTTGNAILGNNDFFLSKQTSLEASIEGVRFLVSPRSFFQVNTGSAGIIYNLVKKLSGLSRSSNVLDLYCGIGAITLFLAPEARGVLGIEVIESAVEDASKNARLNRISNCQFEAGDVVEKLSDILSDGTEIDLVVLNPPRKGCDDNVLKQVAEINPPKIIYVSCSPATLGRDLSTLDSLGYSCSAIHPVDMFPQTTHIESVALLHRR